MNKYTERLYNGVIKENPTFVLMLGMCPTLAVTSSAINGLGMGLSTLVVLVCSNLHSKWCAYSCIYRNCGFPCYGCAAFNAGISAGTVKITGCIHSTDSCKLYYFRPCRKLCFQKWTGGVCVRRNRYGTWFHDGTDHHRFNP